MGRDETLWRELAHAINRRVERKYKFGFNKINALFGSFSNMDTINIIIFIAKQSIVNQRFHEGRVTLASFLITLNRYFEMENNAALKTGR